MIDQSPSAGCRCHLPNRHRSRTRINPPRLPGTVARLHGWVKDGQRWIAPSLARSVPPKSRWGHRDPPYPSVCAISSTVLPVPKTFRLPQSWIGPAGLSGPLHKQPTPETCRYNLKNSHAVRSVSAATFSRTSPRSSAIFSAVNRTCAGSQVFPRKGTGARYGQSVSTM